MKAVQKQPSLFYTVGFSIPLALAGIAYGQGDDSANSHSSAVGTFMTQWLALGPIPVSETLANPDQATQRQAFDADVLAAHGGETGIQPVDGATHRVGESDYTWKPIQSQSKVVDLTRTYGEKDYAIAYLWAEIDAHEAETVLFGIGSDDAVKVWLNGELIHENWVARPVSIDADLVSANLKKGKNRLLLKVQNIQGGWGVACRVLSPQLVKEKLVAVAGAGNKEVVEKLLSYGVDINAPNEYGITALHFATVRKQDDTIRFLLEQGADENIEMPPKSNFVDYLFAEWSQPHSPGASVSIIQNGEIVYKKGYGAANLEYAIPITPSTIFHVASVSKQFTAFAIVMLAQAGKLSLDDEIQKHLPEVPDFSKPITIRHLIHHTSGLRDQWELLAMAGWRLDDVITTQDIMGLVKRQKDLNFNPGDEYLYCNTGYTLMAEIVARVTNQSFRQWTAENIFTPLGMTNTHFHDDHQMIVPNRAYSYSPTGEGGYRLSALNYANVGATSLFTTVEDLAKWVHNFDTARVGGVSVIEQMQQKGKLNNGNTLDYAFGLGIGEYRGLKTVEHSGGDAGYRSHLICFPDQKFAIAVLSNLANFNPGLLSRQVADIYLAECFQETQAVSQTERSEVSVDEAIYDRYLGEYELQSGNIITITKAGGRLRMQFTGSPTFELFPESETKFFLKAFEAQVSFQPDESNRVTQLTFHQNNQNLPANRIEPFDPKSVELDEFVGEYHSEELGITCALITADGKLVAQHRRHGDVTLTPYRPDRFQGNQWWSRVVEFTRDESDAITGFKLTGGRVRNLRFEKQ